MKNYNLIEFEDIIQVKTDQIGRVEIKFPRTVYGGDRKNKFVQHVFTHDKLDIEPITINDEYIMVNTVFQYETDIENWLQPIYKKLTNLRWPFSVNRDIYPAFTNNDWEYIDYMRKKSAMKVAHESLAVDKPYETVMKLVEIAEIDMQLKAKLNFEIKENVAADVNEMMKTLAYDIEGAIEANNKLTELLKQLNEMRNES